MIIGNNFNRDNLTNNTSFENVNIKENQTENNNYQSEANINQNVFTRNIKTISHSNPLDKKDMSDKSLAMLHERLENGLITIEEFNKKCEQLGKLRNKN